MTLDRHAIVCLSSQRWDEGMWTNKQHIMSRLARRTRIVHVDFGLRDPVAYLWHRLRQSRSAGASSGGLGAWLRSPIDGVIGRGPNLWVSGSWSPWGVGRLPRQHRARDYFSYDHKIAMVRRFLEREGITQPIVWVYHPGYGDAVDLLPRRLLVYDCVDDYAAFPEYAADAEWLTRREEALCRKSDVVFTTSKTLLELRKPLNPETYLVENVGDAAHFAKAFADETRVPAEASGLKRPVIAFVGAVSAYKLNLEWMVHAAKARPEWTFLVIGPVGLADPDTNVQTLRQLPNVRITGMKPYDELPAWLKGVDVTVIPYNINRYTASVFPIKFFEMLATGKPVVISPLPSLEGYFGDVLVARDAPGFVAACEDALRDTVEARAHRVALAQKNSWEKRVAELSGHVERRLADTEGL